MVIEITAPTPEIAAEIARRLTGSTPIRIEDRGPADQDRIHETFTRLNNRSSRATTGAQHHE